MDIKVLLVGDVVGKPGRQALTSVLPSLLEQQDIDFVIANGENAAKGSGINERLFWELISAGVNVVTLGDHVWKRKEVLPLLEKRMNLLRPANLPEVCPGAGSCILPSKRGPAVGVVTLLGRIFMGLSDCPFQKVDKEVEKLKKETPIVFVEIHGEASSEKVAMGWKLTGKVSCVFGTHTHVQTADERVLPGGTAYITDLGMTGPHESVIGRDIQSVLYRFETQMHVPFVVATGDVRVCGAIVTVDADTGRARSIERLCIPVPSASGN